MAGVESAVLVNEIKPELDATLHCRQCNVASGSGSTYVDMSELCTKTDKTGECQFLFHSAVIIFRTIIIPLECLLRF